MHRRFPSLLLIALVLFSACAREDSSRPGSSRPVPSRVVSPSPTFGPGNALIDTGDESLIIDVEVAETAEQQRFGLMFRESLPQDEGMVFLFFEPHAGGFWMKNTLIPLSIAFFDDEGKIVSILDMDPCKADPCKIYDPAVPYSGALEVNQGAFDDWGVSTGDRITITH